MGQRAKRAASRNLPKSPRQLYMSLPGSSNARHNPPRAVASGTPGSLTRATGTTARNTSHTEAGLGES
eukprot:11205372-Lingulodinium_polyedra.AAC.1